MSSEAYRDNILIRSLTRITLKVCSTIGSRWSGCVRFVPGTGICIKWGSHVRLYEASNMRFVAAQTSIPVPKVHCAFTSKGKTYIVMEKIKGEMLSQAFSRMSAGETVEMFEQLSRMVKELRNIPVPSRWEKRRKIENVDGGTLVDCRRPGGNSDQLGPFGSPETFHKHLRGGFELHDNMQADVTKLIELQDSRFYDVYFTHADLSVMNYIVRSNKVTGLIDWKISGWYPDYWEYTTAKSSMYWGEDAVEKFIEPWPKELETEQIRQRWFGDT
ncbi:MAG: hypothetical protein M1828_000257 [Chrysothrix sp. TS-e1954]|nr:MAG: hypothetical protein M1828_000257 [Chrysothrix sp. TS-e1954]